MRTFFLWGGITGAVCSIIADVPRWVLIIWLVELVAGVILYVKAVRNVRREKGSNDGNADQRN